MPSTPVNLDVRLPGPVAAGDNHAVETETRGPTIGPTLTRPAFVRPAVAGDEAVLGRLRDQALADLGGVRGGAMYLERHAVALPALPLSSPPAPAGAGSEAPRRVWLGGIEGAEVGYLLGIVVALPSGDRLGVIEGIYVDPDTRGCGIGELMMSVALDWFRSNGCVAVEATALPGARATKNFFEEHGLKARLLTVYRSLVVDEE